MASNLIMAKSTTIKVLKVTKDRLDKYGQFGDTYDDILTRVLDLADKCKQK